MKKDYAKYVRTKIVDTIAAEKTGREWRKGDGGRRHICLDLDDNFIDHERQENCNIKGDIFNEKIGYHIYSHSLNSSQVMCISFFKKFFEKNEYQNVLLVALKACGIEVADNVAITNAIFEYVPDKNENTNFDFYMILSNGQHISFEIKYTEAEFGGIGKRKGDNPNKYGEKWEDYYKKIVKSCPYMKDSQECDNEYNCIRNAKLNPSACEKSEECQIYQFYSHYQINRNISWAKKDTDIVVFLTPRENESLGKSRVYIDSFNNPNIKNLYWENLIEIVLKHAEQDEDLRTYYTKFKKKYFVFVPYEY